MTMFGWAAIAFFLTGLLLDVLQRDFRLISAALVTGGVCFMIDVFVG